MGAGPGANLLEFDPGGGRGFSGLQSLLLAHKLGQGGPGQTVLRVAGEGSIEQPPDGGVIVGVEVADGESLPLSPSSERGSSKGFSTSSPPCSEST